VRESGKSVMGWFDGCLEYCYIFIVSRRYRTIVLGGVVGIFAMLGCGNTVLDQVVVEDVWVRENIAPQKMTAAYLVLRNNGAATALVSAKTNVAQVTELHVVTAQENVMRMRKVERIPIPAGGAATLQPGGNHLMLIGLRRDLVLGEKIDVMLGFENGQTVAVSCVVKTIKN